MKRIRVCRSERVSHSTSDIVVYGEWVAATPDDVFDCEVISNAGNEVFGPGTHWIEFQEVPGGQPNPDVAINRLIAESMQAWTVGDLESHTACFTPGAVFISPSGSCYRGHDGLHRAFESERNAMRGLRITPSKIEIVYPREQMAIVLMEGEIQHSDHIETERWASTQTVVLTPDQKWLFAAHQVFHSR